MPKGSKDGSVFKRKVKLNGKEKEVWFARARYRDPHGQEHELKRRADSYAKACELKRKLLDLAKEKSQQTIDVDRLTFADLVRHYSEHYAIAVQYVGERKVAGLRSLRNVERQLDVLKNHFKRKLLRRITYGDLRTFRAQRLKTKTFRDEQRTIASVNRELATLRRMFNVAVREGWIVKNPFHSGDSLISAADEHKRERILTRDEEENLLEACGERTITYRRQGREVTALDKGRHRPTLRAIIIAAIDTGMRKGELLKLRWSDVDLEAGTINVRAFNTKTMRERSLALTTRLRVELLELNNRRKDNKDSLVFGIGDDFKKSFAGACRAAKLTGLRFHDLRHTHATRLDDLGFSLAKIGAQLGHTQLQTTLRYVNRDKTAMRQVAAALDALYGEGEAQQSSETVN